MNKTQLRKFVESEKEKAVNMRKDLYTRDIEALLTSLKESLGLADVTDALDSKFQEILNIVNVWVNFCAEQGIPKGDKWGTLEYNLNSYTRSKENLQRHLFDYEICLGKYAPLNKMLDDYCKDENEIRDNYNTIIENLRLMSAKEGERYLREDICMDLSSLEIDHPVTALVRPVNLKYIMVNQPEAVL